MGFKFSVTSNINKTIMKGLKNAEAQQKKIFKNALKESGIMMASSLKAGYQKSKDPEGQNWDKLNPTKYPYRPMADGIVRPPKRPVDNSSKPLINTGAMVGSINYALVGGSSVIIGYQTPKESEKALQMHFGTPGTMIIETNGTRRERKITPRARKNMGFAYNWSRIGNYNDLEQIKKVFEAALGTVVKVITS